MGRVTIFTEDDCEQCEWAREILEEWSIPYAEINVSREPERRGDMISLANDLATPQIFFNEKHIRGGASALYKMLQDWNEQVGAAGHYADPRERFEYEVALQADPRDRRLHIDPRSFVTTGHAVTTNFKNKTLVPFPNGSKAPIALLTNLLVGSMPRHTIKKGLRVYHDCFRGFQALQAFMEMFDFQSKEAAVAFGVTLIQHSILHNLTNGNSDDLFSDGDIFRLQPFHKPEILNNHIMWKPTVEERLDPANIILYLSRLMEKIVALLNNGKTTTSILEHDLYQKFTEEVCVLQVLVLPSDTSNNTALFLNLANLMIRHYYLESERRGIDNAWPKRKGDMPAFLSKICYNVGTEKISLYRLTQRVLRGGNGGYNWVQQWLAPLACIAGYSSNIIKSPAIDPRLHFCLSWGTKSSPPVWIYHAESLEQELQCAARQYCAKHVSFDQRQGYIILPKLFKWNKSDFGKTPDKIVARVVDYLSKPQLAALQYTRQKHNGKVKILYHDYVWQPQRLSTPGPIKALPQLIHGTRLQELFSKPPTRPKNRGDKTKTPSKGTVTSESMFVGDENSTWFSTWFHGDNSTMHYPNASHRYDDSSIFFHGHDATWSKTTKTPSKGSVTSESMFVGDENSTWFLGDNSTMHYPKASHRYDESSTFFHGHDASWSRTSGERRSDDFSVLHSGGLEDDNSTWYRPSVLKRPHNFSSSAVPRGQDVSGPPIRPFHRKDMAYIDPKMTPLTESSSESSQEDDFVPRYAKEADDVSEFQSIVHKGGEFMSHVLDGDDETWATYAQIGDDSTWATRSRHFSGDDSTWATTD